MAWLKRGILFILSLITIVFLSCENTINISKNEQSKVVSKEELVQTFFSKVQSWSKELIPRIDSLGIEIGQSDSILTFYPFINDYEPNSFIFSAKDKSSFYIFEQSEFLKQSEVAQQSSYKVWRKKLNELQILDFSIEPHPTLGWLFVTRLRGQE
ncbi:MAG TPA: hypothetical protein VKX29_04215 [Brumimicrobium sp.]|nr:hypothetical protein [Brumimicrobium sp.]